MTVATTGETHENKVLIEQVTILFESMLSLLLINLLVSACLIIGLWNVVALESILIWVGLLLLMLTVRMILYFNFKKQFDIKRLLIFRLLLVLGSGFAGIVWGLGGLLLFPEAKLEYQVFLLFALMAMITGSAYSLSIYTPTFFAFAPLTLLPITIQLFIIGGNVHYSLVALSIVFLIAKSSFNLKINKTLKRSLNLRFENHDLIEKLHLQKTEAERANHAKSKFLADASHDLRQPLYSLSLFTAVLDESTKDPKIRKIVDQINVSVDALKNLFDALLDISKLDAGAVEAQKVDFSVQPLFEKLSNAFDMQALEKGIIIKWPRRSCSVTSEAYLLEQILRNYLENAIRYTSEGIITVECKLIAEMVVISVNDTGIGIHQDDLQNIFTEFHQLDNAERDRTKGLGLGLAIVDRTARLLGHDISVTSDLGIGSTFSIKLKQGETAISEERSSAKENTLTDSDDCLLIAIVDDEKIIREGILQLFQMWDYEIVAAASSNDLMGQLDQIGRQPDVLITDYRLADNLTGIDVITALHSKYQQDIPALIVTGDTDQKQIKKMNAGQWHVLHKPVSAAKLRTFLRSVQKTEAMAK